MARAKKKASQKRPRRRRGVRNPAIPRLTWVAKNYPPGVLYFTINSWFIAAGLDQQALQMAAHLNNMWDPDMFDPEAPEGVEREPEVLKNLFLNFASYAIREVEEENTEYDKYIPWLAKNILLESKKPLKRANKAIKEYYSRRGEAVPDIYPIDLLDIQYARENASEAWIEMMVVPELSSDMEATETALVKVWGLREGFGTIVAWVEATGVNLDDYSAEEAFLESQTWAQSRPKDLDIVVGDVVYEFDDGWTFQELKTKKQLKCEGRALVHCVKSYKPREIGVVYRIFSLRDPDGQPMATMEWSVPGEFVVQYRGLSNKNPERDEVGRAIEFRLKYLDKELVSPQTHLTLVPEWQWPPYLADLYGGGKLVAVFEPKPDDVSAWAIYDNNALVSLSSFERWLETLEEDAAMRYGDDDAESIEVSIKVALELDRIELDQLRMVVLARAMTLQGWRSWEVWRQSGFAPYMPPGLVIIDELVQLIRVEGDRALHEEFANTIAENPRKRRTRPKAKRKMTPDWKQLIERSHRHWEAYDAKPLKKNLLAFGKHAERMEKSSSLKVKTESRRAARAFNAEFKARGWKKPVANPKRKVAKKKAKSSWRANPDESSLFHVTYAGRLLEISEDGLGPDHPSSIGGDWYDWHRKDSIFLSESPGVPYWYHWAGQWAFDWSDEPVADGLVPVVLRIVGGPLTDDLEFLKVCEDDDLGWMDSGQPAYTCKTSIDPKDIQVWTGSSWVPVRDYGAVDLSTAFDMHTWENVLLPTDKEMESGKKKPVANPKKKAKKKPKRNPAKGIADLESHIRIEVVQSEPEVYDIDISGYDEVNGREEWLGDAQMEFRPDCDAWSVFHIETVKGWGPFLYDLLIELATKMGSRLTSDKFSGNISPAARNVWRRYQDRTDVTASELPDGCLRAGFDYLNVAYTKKPDTVTALERRGTLVMR